MNGLPAMLASFHLLRPWWLLALLALPLLAWWWRVRSRRNSAWRDLVDAHLLPQLLDDGGKAATRAWSGWFALSGLALAILALAGPSLHKDEHPLWQTSAPLVVALDLSSATLARDLPPTRLAQARAKLATLLGARSDGQVALVVFADDAFTVAPLTEDTANVALFLDALAPAVMPEDGHRVDRAIAWSRRLLEQAGYAQGDILLLTDRADGTDVVSAGKAADAGYRVSALGLGTAEGGVFEGPAGGLERAQLDEAALRRLAAAGGGGYARLTAGDADLRALGVLDPRANAGVSASGEKVASWRDDGYWLLPLAMLLCLPLFRRGGLLVAVLACTLLLPAVPAIAQSNGTGGSLWQRPDQAEYRRMQEGVAAYRRKDWAQAIDRFAGVDSADGQYNLGNALAKAGRYDEAIAAYDRALRKQPGMGDAILNRKAVELAKKLPKRQGDQGQDGKQPQRQPGDAGQGEARPGQDGDQDQQRKPQEGRQPPTPPQAEPPGKPDAQAQDAQRQQQANEAQRQRMQEAMRRQQDETQGEPQPAEARQAEAQETPEQRERRLANQAWLQRVPDDPGALLRARFRLEAERRRGGQP